MNKRRDVLRELLTPVTSEQLFSAENNLKKPQITSGALQSMNDAITGLSREADELREAVAGGYSIIEVDTALIDPSFVKDRLDEFSGPDFEALVESIRTNGQGVPVLLRPNPEKVGRYQIAYGHRRVAALKQLGKKVKSFIRNLTDDELIIAQGNENLERKDLTFIEKAFFAKKLEDRGTARSVILATFGTSSRGVLSEMISLARKIPENIVHKVGSAPGVGRPKWDELATLLQSYGGQLDDILESEAFLRCNSAQRFEIILSALRPLREKTSPPKVLNWDSADDLVRVRSRTKNKAYAVEFSQAEGKAFGEWISARIDRLYEQYQKDKDNK
ncbi:plasmid partitioning protein RepB [Falsochrobactrum ovis]|uniref:ParB family chromosome partitioning protein n=1 Tax=Falsochrobactrum ovis TaxID=1293442 RepID=A0A364JRZ2_9HYPH|nr:plasmid partitioning protein RepB [Falsochrobactrum ovis]RAK25638.1 ParB family chromosome partitioning protein [Falsochrobactrum ovis]